MFVLQALKSPKYLALAAVFGILIMGLYAFLQALPQGLNNFWFWFTLLTPFAWFLYLLYGILFGITLSFFAWQKNKKVCPPRTSAKGGFLGILGGFFGTTAPVCAGCLPWLTLVFPTSFIAPLLQRNLVIMIFSIALLFLALWILGGFKRTPTNV